MSENKRIVGIVPARGGSKSIPRKNVKLLGGIPLIAYSIEAGLRSKYLDRVIVSTDDPEIAAVAREWGAEVPFMRPAELAGDLATDLPVFEHALRWLEEEGYRCDAVVQLRPTSPFRPPACVDEAVEVLLSGNADSVRGITPSGQNPYKMWRIEDGMMQPLLDSEFAEPYNMPRQELPDTFWQTGHVEVIRTATILEMGSMTGHRIAPYVLDPA
ncbi:MAG: acylneuraminate cytidylyltransferase family protein, partial [Saprospiraceae bacterium]|nr:acylneuraminate cytidylyltransferase family protein [Saprospiraceae bacterium]